MSRATQPHTTNVVAITESPRLKARITRAIEPEPLYRSPELAILLAVLHAMPRKQRTAIRATLFRKALETPGDDCFARAYHHVGRVL